MLDVRTKELIAVGASVVAKCQPCLTYHVAEARKAGVSDCEMKEAIGIARMVRKKGTEIMDKFADAKLGGAAAECAAPGGCNG